jgi:NADH:ubiquinone oxidoreductase subunit C
VADVLARRDQALTPEETEALLRDRLGDAVAGATVEHATFTLHVTADGWVEVARHCRDESLLAYDMFDCLFGVDAREEGFDVVAVLYSTSTGNRICLRARCEGGREAPRIGSITDVYRGADWMERETWDMFGIEFDGHPGLEPRILTAENFEGWPLRKDFHLASRVAKPWPGVKEPAELDEEGNVIEREPKVGDAPGPYDLDKAMADQARAVNAPAVEEPAADEVEAGEAEAEEATDAAVAPDADDTDTDTEEGDAGASAQERAEERRREQAEARARKAAERAATAEADAGTERDAGADDEPGAEDPREEDA